MGFVNSKTASYNSNAQPTESGLGQLVSSWRADPRNSSEARLSAMPSTTARIQDYGAITQLKASSSFKTSVNPTEQRLEFNDLQSRAQHIIINELMRRVSPPEHTAVIFSALPAPLNGTHKHEQDSIAYIENLEVLVQDLPPVMLIHANSLTVTMSL
jgi:potassium/chloride transporter 9